jgi:hypothetical protein
MEARIPDFGPRIDPDAVLPSIEEPDMPTKFSTQWSSEEDQRLLELVLEKVRLSQEDWDECARQIGRTTTADVSQRFNSFIGEGRIGLRRGRQ